MKILSVGSAPSESRLWYNDWISKNVNGLVYNMSKMNFFADTICEELNIKNYFIDCGSDEFGNVVGLNYEREKKEWMWKVGEKKLPIKDIKTAEKLFFKSL